MIRIQKSKHFIHNGVEAEETMEVFWKKNTSKEMKEGSKGKDRGMAI